MLIFITILLLAILILLAAGYRKILIIKKNTKHIMSQNDQALAILAELQESQAKLAADLQTIIDNAGATIPQSTLDALQAVADGIKGSADSIDAVINPPAAKS